MIEGLTSAFILSLSLFPGTVWVVRLGVVGRPAQVIAACLGFGLSQFLWILVSVPGLMMMLKNLHFVVNGMYWFAALNLAYMSYKFARTKRAEQLEDVNTEIAAWQVFRNGFVQALAMPMRLPLAMALVLSTGTFMNNPPIVESIPGILIGAMLGTLWWWGQLGFLAVLFAKKVPVPVTLKSINKIRPLCVCIYAVLAVGAIYLSL